MIASPLGESANLSGKSANNNSRRLAIGLSAQSGADHILMPRMGLHLPQRLAFDKWVTIGQQLSAVRTSSAWCLGDWLVFGEAAFTGRYRDAIELTSLDYQTLRNYAWVARRFPMSRRRDKLSFGHHAEVAGLSEPEQDFWLRKAEDLSWSRNHLRREVRSSLRERGEDCPPDGPADPPSESEPVEVTPAMAGSTATPVKIEIRVSTQLHELFESQARTVGLSVEAWARLVLSRAAKDMSESSPETALQVPVCRTFICRSPARCLLALGARGVAFAEGESAVTVLPAILRVHSA
jgi:hypothetical protein